MERVPVLLVTFPQPEEVVHGAGHDRVHAVLLLGAGVDVPQQPLAGDLEMLLGRLRAHRVADPAAPPRVVEPGAILDGGRDRPRRDQGEERAGSDHPVQDRPLLLHVVLSFGRAPTASRERR